jgi:hypothetical protein
MDAVFAVASLFLFLQAGESPTDTLFVHELTFGKFERATRITLGPQGWIYVVDSRQNTILTFKKPSDLPSILGGFGWSATSFDNPTAVATDGLNLYVSDYGNHRIQRFDRYSNLISSLSTRDTSYAPATIGYPTGVALGNMGDLFVLDSENLKVVKFSADGRFDRAFGDLNVAGGKLESPVKVCVHGDQSVYVLDKNRVLLFDYFGNFVRPIGTSLTAMISGGQDTPEGVAVVSNDTLSFFRSDGALASSVALTTLIADAPIRNVQDVAIAADRIYVLTQERCFVFKMQSMGR